MNSHDPQLLKGVLSMLLLQLLNHREDYGYSVVVRLKELGFDDLAEGTVYPALTRLEKRKLLTSRLVKSASGPARKYYRLTEAGLSELERAISSWTDLVASVEGARALYKTSEDEEQTEPPSPLETPT